jgi:hypothetical protein
METGLLGCDIEIESTGATRLVVAAIMEDTEDYLSQIYLGTRKPVVWSLLPNMATLWEVRAGFG